MAWEIVEAFDSYMVYPDGVAADPVAARITAETTDAELDATAEEEAEAACTAADDGTLDGLTGRHVSKWLREYRAGLSA